MRPELDHALTARYPLMYADRHASKYVSAMHYGFPGDGWFDLIDRTSALIEAELRVWPKDWCRCGRRKAEHPYLQPPREKGIRSWLAFKARYLTAVTVKRARIYLRQAWREKRFRPRSIKILMLGRRDLCVSYRPYTPRAAQVKQKLGCLVIHMTHLNPKIGKAIARAHAESKHICEVCGRPGQLTDGAGPWRTVCEQHRDSLTWQGADV